MYSASNVAVDKGLGVDFSQITDLVKSALPIGLNIYQQKMQLKQVKAMRNTFVASGMNVPVVGLPAAQMYGMGPQPNIPGQFVPMESNMFSTSTLLMMGLVGLVGVGAIMFVRR